MRLEKLQREYSLLKNEQATQTDVVEVLAASEVNEAGGDLNSFRLHGGAAM